MLWLFVGLAFVLNHVKRSWKWFSSSYVPTLDWTSVVTPPMHAFSGGRKPSLLVSLPVAVSAIHSRISPIHMTNNRGNPDSKVHGANIGPTWILSVPSESHVDPINLAVREDYVAHHDADFQCLLVHCVVVGEMHKGIPELLHQYIRHILGSVVELQCRPRCSCVTQVHGRWTGQAMRHGVLSSFAWQSLTNSRSFEHVEGN